MPPRRSTNRSATSSSLTPGSWCMRCRNPDRTATARTRAVHPGRKADRLDRKAGHLAAGFLRQRDFAMVGARSDWAKLLLTRLCRPNSGRDPAHRPGRDTTQGSHSRGESMLRKVQRQVLKGSRYQTHRVGQHVHRSTRSRASSRACAAAVWTTDQGAGKCQRSLAAVEKATCLQGRTTTALSAHSGGSERYPNRPVM